jgi:protein CpxP
MNATWKRAAAAGALCLGLAAAAAAGAQDRPAAGGPPSAARNGEHRRMMFEQMRQRREQRLHDLLQIKPDQEAAFHTFLAAAAPPRRDGDKDGKGRGGPGGGQPPAPLTTPQRLDRMAARMAERQQRFQQVAAATRTFYGVLSAEQRKAFDEMGPMMGRGHGRARGGHGFGGPHR